MRTCNTCEKRWYNPKVKSFECSALTELIGKTQECYAWTNDPGWFRELQKAVRLYAKEKEGGKYAK